MLSARAHNGLVLTRRQQRAAPICASYAGARGGRTEAAAGGDDRRDGGAPAGERPSGDRGRYDRDGPSYGSRGGRYEGGRGRGGYSGGYSGRGGRGGGGGSYRGDRDEGRRQLRDGDGDAGRGGGDVADGGGRGGYGGRGGGGGERGSWQRRDRDNAGPRGDRPRYRDEDGGGRGGGRGGYGGRGGAAGPVRSAAPSYADRRAAAPAVQERYSRDEEADDAYGGEDVDLDHEPDNEDEQHEAAAGSAARRGPSGPPLRDSLQGEALYGVFPVLAALRAGRRKVHRAFMFESIDLSKRKDAGLIRQVEALCEAAEVDVVRVGRHELNLMSHDRPHQGLVLDVAPLTWTHMDEFPSAAQAAAAAAAAGAPPPVWLALDEVVDPQNLGAVVRSAYCLGAAGVLACSRNCAPLSPVVSKASAGALEALPLHSCHNLPRTLLDARDLKGWAVLGAAAGSGSQPVGRVAVSGPTILVLGSEGFGLRTNTRRACSQLVRVEMAPSSPASASASSASSSSAAAAPARAAMRGLVDSLNVSVATGILLHSLLSSAAASVAGAAGAGAAAAEGAGAGAGAGGEGEGAGEEEA
ncbi:hypothetical protein HXX76_002261 [Chlamydomonas incerta]|uniref:rRNA methyltransferase 1, mitochondrial n=1 Tax=Chlamydomonas incerta TaxID=51695 RepID=A0A835WAR1_CHLIN|nr:hypothetical protein HXX76_002261 [Chlamydomonas incerta]|eukprot:KAG2443921.1 hypothetical protein HXX76_002261 [Chlamydomonas incerta]